MTNLFVGLSVTLQERAGDPDTTEGQRRRSLTLQEVVSDPYTTGGRE